MRATRSSSAAATRPSASAAATLELELTAFVAARAAGRGAAADASATDGDEPQALPRRPLRSDGAGRAAARHALDRHQTRRPIPAAAPVLRQPRQRLPARLGVRRDQPPCEAHETVRAALPRRRRRATSPTLLRRARRRRRRPAGRRLPRARPSPARSRSRPGGEALVSVVARPGADARRGAEALAETLARSSPAPSAPLAETRRCWADTPRPAADRDQPAGLRPPGQRLAALPGC